MTGWLGRLAWPWRWRLTLSAVLGTCTIGSSLGLMATSGYLISRASQQPPVLELGVAIALVRLFGLTRGGFRYAERVVSHDLAFRLLEALRLRTYQALVPLAPAGLETFRSGDLLSRLVADVEGLQDFFLRGLAPPLVAALVLGLAAGILWPLAPAAVPALAACYLLAAVGLPLLSDRLSTRPAKRRAELRSDLQAEIVDLVQGARESTAYGNAHRLAARVRRIDGALAGQGLRLAAIAGGVEGGALALSGFAAVAVLVPGMLEVRGAGLDGTWLATLALAALASFEAVQPLPAAFQRIAEGRAGARRLVEIESLPTPVEEPREAVEAVAGRVVFDSVTVAYGDRQVLGGFDLVLEPGSRVALVGPSGAGKTTVANLLLRFRDPDRGRVTMAGIDLRRLRGDEVRRVVGLCAQDAHLFNTSLLENLRLARPAATTTELEAAAEHARLADWIRSLPLGWETPMGEGGAQVSGGQRQRIGLARLLLAGPSIAVLDEPTANLDPRLGEALMDDVLDALEGRTVLLITHHPHGLARMDEVVELRDGRAVRVC